MSEGSRRAVEPPCSMLDLSALVRVSCSVRVISEGCVGCRRFAWVTGVQHDHCNNAKHVCVWPVFRWLTDVPVRVADCVRGARWCLRSSYSFVSCSLRAGAGAFGWAGDAALSCGGTVTARRATSLVRHEQRAREARRAPGFWC